MEKTSRKNQKETLGEFLKDFLRKSLEVEVFEVYGRIPVKFLEQFLAEAWITFLHRIITFQFSWHLRHI